MDANRWEVTDATGLTHVVSVHKGMLGAPSLRVNGRQVMNLGGEGIVAFQVAGREARLSPQPGGAGYDFAVGSMTAASVAAPAPVTPAAGVDPRVPTLLKRRERGANWFVWIGALSAINTILMIVGLDWEFLAGMGITDYIAGIVYVLGGDSMLWLAIVLDIPVVGAVFWLAVQARRGAAWPFVVGGLVYAFDLLLVLTLEDWLSGLIHVVALFSFANAWRAARALDGMEPAAA